MIIAIASDHAGFDQKESLKKYLEQQGNNVIDCGCFSCDSVDYPDFGSKAAKLVSEGRAERGILVCGSGMGMCIVANRFTSVRAAVLRNEDEAKLSRDHNDANVACFGGRSSDMNTIKKLTDIFLTTPFGGGRHKRRVDKIDKLEI